MPIILPERFVRILSVPENAALNSYVSNVSSVVDQWLQSSQIIFFPDYTDHSARHIQEVIHSASELISEDSWEAITADDIASLIISIIIHDAGMHLNSTSFLSVINGFYDGIESNYFKDDPSWSTLWLKFNDEARKFGESTLMAIYGDVRPVRQLPDDVEDWSERDKKLIGEFLRRHHPRLAHNILIKGLPGPNSETALSFDSIPIAFRDRCGLIARSHGLELREAVSLIPKQLQAVDAKVHMPFLMILVRIGDYIQMHSGRAPELAHAIKSIRSPISKREWDTHRSVTNVLPTGDPESLYVQVDPNDIVVLDRMKFLIGDIQQELDKSWGVLGEIYGRMHEYGMSKLGIKIRRIKSNLVDDNNLNSLLGFYPEPARLSSSNASLIELLVKPLYGNSPFIGIRELVQNSIDAVEAYKYYSANNMNAFKDVYLDSLDILIELESSDEGNFVKITDNGIGMTTDMVIDYFLKAGASFRKSRFWEEYFSDSEGKSKTYRSGRFGIGALAGFLIGPNISVTTRHATEPEDKGIEFTYSISDDLIQLNKVTCPVGTKIVIKVTAKEKWNQLINPKNESCYRWYISDNLRIKYNVLGQEKHFDGSIPDLEGVDIEGFRRLKSEQYDRIYWTYKFNNFTSVNDLIIGSIENGSYGSDRGLRYLSPYKDRILSMLSSDDGEVMDDDWYITYNRPSIIVRDQDGYAPLNLSRSRLIEEWDFIDSLIEDISYDLIAYLLAFAANDIKTLINQIRGGDLRHAAINDLGDHFNSRESWVLFNDNGIIANDPAILNNLNIERLIMANSYNIMYAKNIFICEENFACCVIRYQGTMSSLTESIRHFSGYDGIKYKFEKTRYILNESGKNLFFDNKRTIKSITNTYSEIHTIGETGLYEVNSGVASKTGDPGTTFDLADVASYIMGIAEISDYFKEIKETPLSRVWTATLGNKPIPFAQNERGQLAKSHPRLSYFYEEYRNIIKEQRTIHKPIDVVDVDPVYRTSYLVQADELETES